MVLPDIEPPSARGFVAALLATAVLASTANADERAPTLEQLELQRLMEKAAQVFEKQTLPIEPISADFHYRCLRATGAAALCECLVERRPYSLRFEHYVRITSRTKSELGYDKLSDAGRHLVDEVYALRDACVVLGPRAPADE